ncbi:MAG: HPr family phosphocarrier protein [Lachnospiraceae bacterium]|nr:HPr family phosphocarrier protein [Lachnospiraceae bacterium]
MIKKKFVINNPTGLHIRPAGVLCDCAMRYESSIRFLYREESEANVKSILSVLGACIRCGDEIELICDGSDEEKAMSELTDLIENGLGE